MRRRLAWWTDLSSSWTPQVGPGQQTELCMRVRKSHYLQKHLVLALEFHVFQYDRIHFSSCSPSLCVTPIHWQRCGTPFSQHSKMQVCVMWKTTRSCIVDCMAWPASICCVGWMVFHISVSGSAAVRSCRSVLFTDSVFYWLVIALQACDCIAWW